MVLVSKPPYLCSRAPWEKIKAMIGNFMKIRDPPLKHLIKMVSGTDREMDIPAGLLRDAVDALTEEQKEELMRAMGSANTGNATQDQTKQERLSVLREEARQKQRTLNGYDGKSKTVKVEPALSTGEWIRWRMVRKWSDLSFI